ncbi:MAG: hypothetical protein IT535_03790 [Bauldia sp.]|nr:hypothetical protein [Bauldia sp.]
MAQINFAGRTINLPRNRLLRMGLGILLILGGLVGWLLPLLGVWMLPLGLVVLSVDIPFVRRQRRRADVAVTRWWNTSPFAARLRDWWSRIRRRNVEGA